MPLCSAGYCALLHRIISANQNARRVQQAKKMEGLGWILLAVFCLTLVEGKSLDQEIDGGLNMLNQLFGGQDNCDGGYKCSNGK